MDEFTQRATEQLRYYVYCLFDPRTQKIFYVGKGQGNRVIMHLRGALEGDTETEKLETIREILAAGLTVGHYILRGGLETEKIAYEIEASVIDLLTFPKFKHLSDMTNQVSGHHSWDRGIRTTGEVEDLYGAKSVRKREISHKLLIININRQYSRGMDPYEATRRWWRLNIERAKQADFIVSEYRGIFRALYRANPNGWQSKNHKGRRRWEFSGDEVLDKSILDLYLHHEFKDKKKGTRNPIRYVNI